MAAMLGGHNNVTIKAGLFKSYKWTHFGFLGKSVGETHLGDVPWKSLFIVDNSFGNTQNFGPRWAGAVCPPDSCLCHPMGIAQESVTRPLPASIPPATLPVGSEGQLLQG